MTTITPADEEAEEQRMYDIIRDTFAHFSHMPACDARRRSKRLRDELYAVMDDIAAGRRPAALYTDEERDAELYRALNRLCVSPVRPGAGGTRDLWTLLRLLEDICEVLADSGKKKLADVLYERLDDYTVRPGPLSRLLDLWEPSDLRGQRPQGSTHGDPVRLL